MDSEGVVIEITPAKNVGFLDPKTGRLRSKEELQALDAASSDETTKARSTDSVSSDTSVTTALRAVRARSSGQVNGFVSVLNKNVENLKDARDNVRGLRTVAKDLKQAIKAGDEETASSLREEFRALQIGRDKLSEKIQSDNRESSGLRRQSVQLGKDTIATLETDEVKFSSSSTVDLDSVEGVNQFLESSRAELDDLKAQIQDEKKIRKQARQVNKDIRQELRSIGSTEESRLNTAIQDIEQAGGVANSLRAEIGAQASLEQSLVSEVEQSIAADLLSDPV